MDLDTLVRILHSTAHSTKIEYTNELEYMNNFFHNANPEITKRLEKTALDWFQYYEYSKCTDERDVEFLKKTFRQSEEIRLEGNRVFQWLDNSTPTNYIYLKSIRLYTEAIYAATKAYSVCKKRQKRTLPDAKNAIDCKECEAMDIKYHSNMLSLSYANRALSLLRFGYVQEAYDDCCMALDIGYPKEEKRYQVILCQLKCVARLNDIMLLSKHLKELKDILNVQKFSSKDRNQLIRYIESYEKILEEKQQHWIETEETFTVIDNDRRSSQEICYSTKNDYGRYIVNRQPLKADEIISKERATAISPITIVCHQCATSNFIPIPCKDCGIAVYCSLSCLRQHKYPVHQYECLGYRMQFLMNTGVGLMGLHMLLDNGLMDMLSNRTERDINAMKSTQTVWNDLINSRKNDYDNSYNSFEMKSYRESLQMVSHLDRMPQLHREMCATLCHLMVMYLRKYTDYFECLQKITETNEKTIDWNTIVAALLLRHAAQIQVNAFVANNIVLIPSENVAVGGLSNEYIWTKPWHLKRGYLHCYGVIGDIAVLNLPYASLCNNACIYISSIKTSGRWITTYAKDDLPAGKEITHSYRADYKHKPRKERIEELRGLYYFDCDCEFCDKKQRTEEEADKDFLKYHQYCCENDDCMEIFVPNLPILEWWGNSDWADIICTKCGTRQSLQWWSTFLNFVNNTKVFHFNKLMNLYNSLDRYLIGFHDCKVYVAKTLVESIFAIFTREQRRHCQCDRRNHLFKNMSFSKDLVKIIRFVMAGKRDKEERRSLFYVIAFTFLWDLIALDCYDQFDPAEIREMLNELIVLPDDVRIIFINYYVDYVKDKVER